MMASIKKPSSAASRGPLGLDPTLFGTICCVIAAIGYTGVQICGRQLAELKADPFWVICVKESVTVFFLGPWLLYQGFRGRWKSVPLSVVAVLFVVALGVQVIGNVPSQWAYGVVGLTIAVPGMFGAMLIVTAILGWVVLKERVSRRSIAAISLLVLSILVLSSGAGEASRSVMNGSTFWVVAAGIAAICMAGCMFGTFSVVIRKTVTEEVPITILVFITTVVGSVVLGIWSVGRLGVDTMLDTPFDSLKWMLLSGTLNLISFLALTKGLQLTNVVRANVINATQVALASIAGMLFFNELHSPLMIVGIGLTVVGVMLVDRPVEEAIL